MTLKTFTCVAALALSTTAFAASKSYDVILEKNIQAGAAKLVAGEYHVKVDGSNAIFTPMKGHEAPVTVAVKVESADKKFDSTTMDTVNQNGAERLKELDLGGSKTKLEFGQ